MKKVRQAATLLLQLLKCPSDTPRTPQYPMLMAHHLYFAEFTWRNEREGPGPSLRSANPWLEQESTVPNTLWGIRSIFFARLPLVISSSGELLSHPVRIIRILDTTMFHYTLLHLPLLCSDERCNYLAHFYASSDNRAVLAGAL